MPTPPPRPPVLHSAGQQPLPVSPTAPQRQSSGEASTPLLSSASSAPAPDLTPTPAMAAPQPVKDRPKAPEGKARRVEFVDLVATDTVSDSDTPLKVPLTDSPKSPASGSPARPVSMRVSLGVCGRLAKWRRNLGCGEGQGGAPDWRGVVAQGFAEWLVDTISEGGG